MIDAPAARDAWPPEFGPGIYLHVPLCRARCPYCDFYSETAVEDRREPLIRFLTREMDRVVAAGDWRGVTFRTIYLGGGTPSLLGGMTLARLLDEVRARFSVDPAAEVTVEANPESLAPEMLPAWRQAGVNRVSLGAQSLLDAELRLLGRLHDAGQVLRRVEELATAGIERIGLDLIYGLPGSSLESWDRTLSAALRPEVAHLSAYLLTLEGGVRMQQQVEAGELHLPDDEQARAQYERLCRRAGAAGFRQYEISNFARPGAESRHNENYWVRGEYLGLGPAAHSHRAGRRWANPRSFDLWARRLEEGESPAELLEEVGPRLALEEWLFLGLRRAEGVPWRVLRRHAPTEEAWSRLRARAGSLERAGLVQAAGDWLRLTPRARFVSNGVFTDLMAVLS